jgi:hypothetical protein
MENLSKGIQMIQRNIFTKAGGRAFAAVLTWLLKGVVGLVLFIGFILFWTAS